MKQVIQCCSRPQKGPSFVDLVPIDHFCMYVCPLHRVATKRNPVNATLLLAQLQRGHQMPADEM